MLATILGRLSNTWSENRRNSKLLSCVKRFEYNNSVVEVQINQNLVE